ncbi:peptidase family C78-domain-containing protein [Neohortaea acidophila]|uniref:Peptidase family C78-domain-containing protein n=1 Tax=Neohortaea acidophila TaxID=245834 RepID=A0A6A6PYS5_9PEZI|nr:peptidase family C78-domain-containing protein [Neohortaea acidophila]KAF2484613.1 peptidase family C78-domain-containing protein [Neohortaea acidophila]
MAVELHCPFCGFQSQDGEYAMQLHIEEHHTDDSPFVAIRDNLTSPAAQASGPTSPSEELLIPDEWTKCTRPGCGEFVHLSGVDEHLGMHEAIAEVEQDDQQGAKHQKSASSTRKPSTPNGIDRSPAKRETPKHPSKPNDRPTHTLIHYFSGTSTVGRQSTPAQRTMLREPSHPGRLGRRELGPHAYEKVMPAEVRRRLLNYAIPQQVNRIGRDGRLHRETYIANETSGLVHALADLSSMDPTVEVAYFCDPGVRHIAKLNCEGNFCGYWNIQMQLSLVIDSRTYVNTTGFQIMPNVLQIQDTIEQAWNNGICPYGRVETGGVRGTRKWIGTHEAVACLTQLGMALEPFSFKDEGDGVSFHPAGAALLDHVEASFLGSLKTEANEERRKASVTTMPPMYFQRFGHSTTIVGLERKRDGSRNLLVFDPSFATTSTMKLVLEGGKTRATPEALLRPYRRSEQSLSQWNEFELIL